MAKDTSITCGYAIATHTSIDFSNDSNTSDRLDQVGACAQRSRSDLRMRKRGRDHIRE